jgi:hypothetical protein
VAGDTCVGVSNGPEGNGENGTWTSVELISSTGGVLAMDYGGASAPLNYQQLTDPENSSAPPTSRAGSGA